MPSRSSLFGGSSHEPGGYLGKFLPTYRTTYPASVARVLHALAESNPSPTEYRTERARILGGTP